MKRVALALLALGLLAGAIVIPSAVVHWGSNPTLAGGVPAPLHQILARDDVPSLWAKTGTANTAWTQIAGAGAATLPVNTCGASSAATSSDATGAWTCGAFFASGTFPITTCGAGAAITALANTGVATCTVLASTPGSAIYGDGVDGALVFDGASSVLGITPSSNVYTLNQDVAGTNVTINSGVKISTNGFRIFATGTLTNNGTIRASAVDGVARIGGAAPSSGVYPSPSTGGSAGANGTGAGNAGNNSVNVSFKWGGAGASAAGASNTTTGGCGGGGSSAANLGGISGTKVAAGASGGTFDLTTALHGRSDNGFGVAFTFGCGGGGGGTTDGAGLGGGGGAGAGLTFVAAKTTAGNGSYEARGGDGAAGTAPTSGAGGGGGGGGGWLVITYSTGGGAATTTVRAGAGGPGANGGAAGGSGGPGTKLVVNMSGDGTLP